MSNNLDLNQEHKKSNVKKDGGSCHYTLEVSVIRQDGIMTDFFNKIQLSRKQMQKSTWITGKHMEGTFLQVNSGNR